MIDRQPPHNVDAERSCLGAILLNPDAAAQAADILGADSGRFYVQAHRNVYSAMLGLLRDGRPIDSVVIMDAMTRAGTLDASGGASYLFDLSTAVPTSANVTHYAGLVLDMWRYRKLIATTERAAARCYDNNRDWRDIGGRLQADVFEVLSETGQDSTQRLSALTSDALATIDAQCEQNGVYGLSTGLHGLDEITGGFKPSDMLILAARPSVGKTALALNIALHVARQGKAVLFFSLEMAKQSLVVRLLCSEGGVDSGKLNSGFLARGEIPRLTAAKHRLDELPIYINDQIGSTMMELRAKALKVAGQEKLGLVVIDYLQLVSPTRRGDNRQADVAEISKEIKQLARDTRAPVLALSQLTREADRSDDGIPRLGHLRESGQIEADADLVMFLSKQPKSENIINLSVAKHRNGALGRCQLVFDARLQRFGMLATGIEPPPGPVNAPAPYVDTGEYDDGRDDDWP